MQAIGTAESQDYSNFKIYGKIGDLVAVSDWTYEEGKVVELHNHYFPMSEIEILVDTAYPNNSE